MKNKIAYKPFFRLLTRANEIAAQPGMRKAVTQVHATVFAPVANVYCEHHEAVAVAETKLAAANLAVEKTFELFEAVYRATRSVALAFYPALTVPETLKTQPTDTDKLNAIKTLVDIVESYAADDWAKEELAGEFGTLSATYMAELNEVIACAKALANAKQARSSLYPEAYEKFLSFRQVVKDTLGRTSIEYRRLRTPARRGKNEDAEDESTATTEKTKGGGVKKVQAEPKGAEVGEIAKTG